MVFIDCVVTERKWFESGQNWKPRGLTMACMISQYQLLFMYGKICQLLFIPKTKNGKALLKKLLITSPFLT